MLPYGGFFISAVLGQSAYFSRCPSANHLVSFRSTINSDIDNFSHVDVSQAGFAKNPRCEFIPGISNPILQKAYQSSVKLGTVASCVMGIKPYQTGKIGRAHV